MKKVDYSLPVVTGDGRDVRVMGETPEGHAFVRIEDGISDWMVFNSFGEFQSSENGSGSLVTLRNPVIEKKVFIRLSALDTEPSVHRRDPPGLGVASIELTFVDGIVTEAKLARPNYRRIERLTFGTIEPTPEEI